MNDAPSSGPPSDTRGIIDPATMARHVTLTRYPAGATLDGLVEWFWAVRWQFAPGQEHVQRVLNHPSGHISIGTAQALGATAERSPVGRVYGLLTEVSQRRLTGTGWTVAAKTTTGGLGALLGGSARAATDRELTLDDAFPGAALGSDGASLVDRIDSLGDEVARVGELRTALERAAQGRDPQRVAQAREVARVAKIAETDRHVLRVEQLAAAAGVSVRSLQRLFGEYVGASPAWVIRRWRIIEAAERAADGPEGWPGWADLAADLGYADHAHLARDVRTHLGVTPSAYLSSQAR